MPGRRVFRRGRARLPALSCAQPDERIAEAFAFMADAFKRKERVEAYLKAKPEHRLTERYDLTAVARSESSRSVPSFSV